MADDPLIPYHQPYLDTDDLRVVREVLRSGWLTTGAEARRFELELARYLDARAVLAVSSCTAALHLALECQGVRGRAVVVPTLTFTATAAAVVMAGGTPVLADVDPDTLTLGVKEAEVAAQAARHRAVAVMPVHYGGNPSRFREVLQWAQAEGLTVIDDAAHALPATVDAHRVGAAALGAFATCFSFYPTKPITTGEGGALVLRDPDLLPRARRLSLHGIDADAYQRSRAGLAHYQVVEHGWKYNLPDVLAALGRSQLKKADVLWQRRQNVADWYRRALAPAVAAGRLRLPVVEPDCASSWHLYAVRLPLERWAPGWDRDRVAARLRDLGIGTSMHYVPLHLHPYWQAHGDLAGMNNGRFPHANTAYAELLSLPIWVGLTEGQVGHVAERLVQVLEEAQR